MPLGSRSASLCPVCRVALAPDRLATEFPASEHASAVSSSLTVQDLLREASANAGANPAPPLDEQVKRFRKSFWEHDHDPDSSSIPTFGRSARWAPRLDMALGIGALTAVMLIVSGILIHTIWRGSRQSRPEILSLAQIPSASPTAVSPSISQNAKVSAALAVDSASRMNPLPSTVQGWRLWTEGSGANATDSRVVYYQRGKETVELTLIRTPALTPALRHPLQDVADGVRTIANPHGSVQVSPREMWRNGRDYLFFDYAPKTPEWRIFTANPYLPDSPHTVSWYAAPYVETIGASTVQDRDAFLQAYLAAKRQ